MVVHLDEFLSVLFRETTLTAGSTPIARRAVSAALLPGFHRTFKLLVSTPVEFAFSNSTLTALLLWITIYDQ